MARAALRWRAEDLASAAGLQRRTVVRFENGEKVRPATVRAMRRAFEAAGINFLDNGSLVGVIAPSQP